MLLLALRSGHYLVTDSFRLVERDGTGVRPSGTWGGPESGAMFTDPLFSGTGVLYLAAEPIENCTTNRTN